MTEENTFLFRYSLKSIRRNLGRSFFVIFSVSLAVFIAIWVMAFFDGMNAQIEQAVVNNNIGFYQIQEQSFAQTSETKNALALSEVQHLLKEEESFSPELVLEANISTPEGAAGLTLIGIIPEFHQKFLPIYQNMQAGQFSELNNEDQVIIGSELAKQFVFSVGDQLVVNYQDHLGELRSELLTIAGIYQFNGPSFSKRNIYLHQKTFQKLYFNEVQDKVLFNRIAIMNPDFKANINSQDITLKTWKDMNPEMAVVIEFHDGMVKFFFVIIAITILMTVITPIQMLWQERLKEMVMLRVLGVTHRIFWKIGIFELTQMILASFLFSLFIIALIIGWQSHFGMDFSSLHQGLSIERAGIILPSIIHPQMTITQLVYTLVFVTFVLTICYLFAISRTLKKLEAKNE